jgi:ferredoxin-NADP reductase
MPYGDFVIESAPEVVLFAGGTGVTAFTAFLEDLTAGSEQPVTLAYGARTSELLIYREIVERCASRVPSLQVAYFVEQPDVPAGMNPGRVSVDAVWQRLRRPLDASYYISGPPPMLRGIARDLRARDIPAEAIHIDAWE